MEPKVTKEQIAEKYMGEAVEELQHQADRFSDGDFEELGRVDLRENTEMDWVGFIAFHSTRWFAGGFRPYTRETLLAFRKQMVKVMAVAISALRWIDKKLDDLPKADV